MNRIKRKRILLLVIALILVGVILLCISGVFAKTEYIYFDLALGDVEITDTQYTGYVYVEGESKQITGPHLPGNRYYVYQSTETNRSETGYETLKDFEDHQKTACRLPKYDRVKQTVNGEEKLWTEYVTNNTDVKEVSRNWENAATKPGRAATKYKIIFANKSNYKADVTIDNIWSSFQSPGATRSDGGITAHLKDSRSTEIQLRLKGDNRVGNVHYGALKDYENKIIFSNGEDADQTPGSITVADFPSDFDRNHWCSAIGGDDNSCDRSDGIFIDSGVIYAGTTPEDNCTAIGGGGNQYGGVTINGGTVTAVVSSTGTAIGGGIGYGDAGGDTDVTINDGIIYAYNLGITEASDSFADFVPAAAIGGGGSKNKASSLNATITINGGEIYAQSMGGTAIGGGCSASAAGGTATINITGGTIIAKSTAGKYKGTDITAGVSIGGGTGYTAGGSVILNISGDQTVLRTGSIGGGLATKEGAKVGNAQVKIEGGNIIGQVIMAGGASNPCSFTMTGGVIHTTDVINGITIGEANITGVQVKDPQPSIPLAFKRQDGGAVFMNDTEGIAIITGGLIGNCTANNGGAVYMAGGTFILSGTGQLGTNHAKASGGSVYVGGGTVQIGGSVTLKDGRVLVSEGSPDASKCAIRNSDAILDGGGVYVVGTSGQDGATVTMNGGEIHSNTAGQDGGGMYISQGKVDFFGGSFHDNKATKDGGGVYVAGDVHMLGGSVTANRANNGGGFCVEDGTVLMYGGNIDNNFAAENGGGFNVLTKSKDAIVDIFSGSISGNQAKNGGGVAVLSNENSGIHVTVGVNCEHTDLNTETRNFTPFNYPDANTTDPEKCGDAHAGHTHYHIEDCTHQSCPLVSGNTASSGGGGFYLKSMKSDDTPQSDTPSKTDLIFYCVITKDNKADGSQQSYALDVMGGNVEIGDKTYDPKTSESVKGNIVIEESVLVEGGTVDIYGTMDNPKFTNDVTVDIKKSTDHYIDHRIVESETEELKYYKIHYYENFKGDGDTPTGLYIARQYPDLSHDDVSGKEKYDFTIMPSIFSHPGYKIIGWNTNPDGKGGDEYKVNQTYNLKDLDESGKMGTDISGGQHDASLLIIYAIWERSGYVLKFDPNVGAGETYTGTMENQRVTVGLFDGSQSINKNQFVRPGYRFTGWTLTSTPEPTDKVYSDCQIIEEDFTNEDGATVTLYANWEICDHKGFLVYTAEKNVLTESCSKCSGHTATAKVSAVDAVFDGEPHLATVAFSSNWIGERPAVSYEMAPDTTWDEKDDIDEQWSTSTDPKPVHAGIYTAKVTVGGADAKIEYKISPVKWETPAVPKISFKVEKVDSSNYKGIITVTTPTGGNVMYKITHILDDGTETGIDSYSDWQFSTEFINIPYGNYYYFYAKVCADRDHMESDASKSSAYLTTGGNIVYIEAGDGIVVIPKYGTGVFEYTVKAADGYHLRGYQDNLTSPPMEIGPDNLPEFIIPIPGVDPADAHIQAGGIKISRTGPTDGAYVYTLTLVDDKVAYHQITLSFSGAVKDATVTHKVKDGQEFSDFNGIEKPSISRDSAFTVQFIVKDYIPDEYTEQKLIFSRELPAGTTVIMKFESGYWYYELKVPAESIDLTAFTAMGGSDKFSFDKNGSDGKSFTYQFIVDFSKVAKDKYINEGDMTVSLGLTAKQTPDDNTSQSAPSIPAAGSTHISLGIIKPEADFVIEVQSNGKQQATLDCIYKPSSGAASIWNGRNTALVLTAPSTAPSDLTLTTVIDGKTTLYRMNSKGQFIIPLGEVDTKQVQITLNSNLFSSTGDDLVFTAALYVSQSGADESPLNGYLAAYCENIIFTCKNVVPSVRIESNQYLCNVSDTLEITVFYEGIPDSNTTTITAYLQSKTDGQYIDTGAKENIPNDGSNYTVTFKLGQMDKGSYRILVVVQESGANILQVPYYFVIK